MSTNSLGMRLISSWSHPDFRPKDYLEGAVKLWKNSPAVFINFLTMLRDRQVVDTEFKLFEYRLPNLTGVATAGTGDDATDATDAVDGGDGFDLSPGDDATSLYLATGEGANFVVGDMLRCQTDHSLATEDIANGGNSVFTYTGREVVLITAKTGDKLTVERHIGGTGRVLDVTAGTYANLHIEAGTVLRRVGPSYGEGSLSPQAISRNPSVVTSQCQIFKQAVQLSGSAEVTKFRPFNKVWQQLKEESMERIRLGMEEAFLYGVKHSTTDADGNTQLMTPGITSLLSTHVANWGGSVVADTVDEYLGNLLRYGSKVKNAFCDAKALNTLHAMIRNETPGRYDLSSITDEETYGLVVSKLRFPYGHINLIHHPLMSEANLGEMIIVDPEYVRFAHTRGRNLKWMDKIQPNDADYRKGQWFAECGLHLALEETHGYVRGITGLSS
jgi:hypothetical protein